MNKLMAWIIGAVIVIAGIVGAVIYFNNNGAKVTNTQNGQSTDVKTGDNAIIAVNACDVLSEAIAKRILGDAAVKSDAPARQTSTHDVSVSNCVYTAKIDPAGAVRISNTKGVSLLVRASKTTAGAESNKSMFDAQKPAGVQDVDGLGEAAFFNPQFGQLNILKSNNWYIVSNYYGTGGSGGTLEQDKQLVGLLEFK